MRSGSRRRRLLIITPDLVHSFPNVTEADSGVESVKDGERGCDVSDNRPGPEAVKVHLNWIRVCTPCFQCVDRPHGEVAHQQESHTLPAGLLPALFRVVAVAFGCIQNESSLQRGLDDAGDGIDQH